MHKTAMVIGGGVAGIQAALDLGDMGIQTFLVEQGPSIGGRMAQLDKTFPTNDCAMCILSPKLVEAGSHPYLTILSNAEVLSVQGAPPHFRVRVLKKPRYVDEEKCTGCGICMSKCPTKIPDPYNVGLSKTKCIRIPFPQAVPALPILDKEHCLYFQKGKCRICEKVCQAHAIDFEQKEKVLELEVGAIILAAGSKEFDARLKAEYGYTVFPNVLTSLEFERLLSASGPTGGHVTRPSDEKEPKKIAILQCVGSRDVQAGRDHCSAICCMQASKDAIIAQEHMPEVETTIFYMDLRAYGKGFDKFVDRARDKHRTRFVCGRVASVEAEAETDNLILSTVTQEGEVRKEVFNLLVLSVGLEPSETSKQAALRLGVNLADNGFLDVGTFSPVETSRPGIFACGSISGPKDIPESVMEASGAASAAASILGELARKEIRTEYPAERDLRGEPPRVGVFVCRCGINIAATVDVPRVVAYASTLPRVRHAQELLFACAQDSQKTIRTVIEEKRLNRIVVCACTPRTHEPLFQKTLRAAGLNPYLFEFANIREHCSWVHQKEPQKATRKAEDLARNAVARVLSAVPLYKKSLPVNKGALIIGGGLAGMTAALDLANQGFPVHLLEKEEELGGHLREIRRTLKGENVAERLHLLKEKVLKHPHVTVHLNAILKDIQGYVGNFKTTLNGSENQAFEHGVVIVASGGQEYRPAEYLYGQDRRVLTQREFESRLWSGKPDEPLPKCVVMIQCVGSRDEKHPYCSRVCCSTAIKNALALKEKNPKAKVYILFRDLRTYGLKESYYRKAREKGIFFIRFDPDHKPEVFLREKDLVVEVRDALLGRRMAIRPDGVVLGTGIVPNPQNKVLSQFLKVPLDAEGFFLEAHVKLRPVDFATDGVFVCGLAHYPKDIGETIAQARAAAGRAATVLCRESLEGEGKVVFVREDRCSGCGACVDVCAYHALELAPAERVVKVNEALCKGCGACTATCRAAALNLRGFTDEQLLDALQVL